MAGFDAQTSAASAPARKKAYSPVKNSFGGKTAYNTGKAGAVFLSTSRFAKPSFVEQLEDEEFKAPPSARTKKERKAKLESFLNRLDAAAISRREKVLTCA